MPNTHRLYGRVRVGEPVLRHMMQRDGIYHRPDDDGSIEFTFFKYATNRLEARDLVKAVRAFALELQALAGDLELDIDCFDFSRPVDAGDQEECLSHSNREES